MRLIKLAVGITLLLAAWEMRQKSLTHSKAAIMLPPTKTEGSRGDDDFFTRSRPTDYAKTPESKAEREIASRWQTGSRAAGIAGFLVTLIAITPTRKQEPQCDDAEPTHPVPGQLTSEGQ